MGNHNGYKRYSPPKMFSCFNDLQHCIKGEKDPVMTLMWFQFIVVLVNARVCGRLETVHIQLSGLFTSYSFMGELHKNNTLKENSHEISATICQRAHGRLNPAG